MCQRRQNSVIPDGHVAVAGEVEVELHGVGGDGNPGGAGVHSGKVAAQRHIYRAPDDIGNEHLFTQADNEAIETLQTLFPAQATAGGDLVGNVGIAHNGSCNELREHDDVDHVVGEPLHGSVDAAVGVNDIGDGLEGEETDADGKEYFGPPHSAETEGGE